MIKNCRQCSAVFDADVEWKTFCRPCYAKKKQAESERPQQSAVARAFIPDDMLARMIRLCHPDRHGNNEESNMATQWFLSLRDEQRRAA